MIYSKKLASFYLTFLFIINCADVHAQWTTATLSQNREELVATSVGNQILFAGGRSSSGYSSAVDIYDKTSNTWSTATLSEARTWLAAASVGTKAFFAGGLNGVGGSGMSGKIDIYDATSGTWSTSSLSGARARLAAVALGTKVYFGGGEGSNGGNFTNVVDIYDNNTNTWSSAVLSESRVNLAAAAVGTKVIFAGGFKSTGVTDAVDIYDASTNSWTATKLSQAREGIAAAVVGSKVFFAGGNGTSGNSDVIDIYDNTTGTWSTAKLSSKRSNISAAVTGTLAFFAGGDGNGGTGFSDVVDIYNGSTNTWTTSNLSLARSGMASGSLGPKLFFAGGIYDISSDYSNLVDIYETSCTIPEVSISGSLEICTGSSTTLTAAGAMTYTWSPSDGLSGVTGATIVASPTKTTTYTVTGTTTAGCSNTKDVTVIVNGAPIFNVSSTPSTICVGSSAILEANGNNSYTWLPSESLSSLSGISVVAKPTSTTTYTVTATDSHNCTASKTIKVSVNPLPVITINAPAICAGSSASLTASGASTYTWSPASGLSSTTGSITIASPLTTSVYTVTGTDLNNCISSTNFTLTVKELPSKPTITSGTLGASTKALVSSSTSENQWYKSGVPIPGATGQILPAFSDGFYSVQVTHNGCTSAMSDEFFVIVTALTESLDKSDYLFYPNPTNGMLFFNSDEKIEVTVFDLMGRAVLSKSIDTAQGLDVGELSSGNYIIQLRQGKSNKTGRLIKN